MNILAVVEQRDGTLRRSAAEVVTAAKSLADAQGGKVHALVIGPANTDTASLAKYGADTIQLASGEAADHYDPDVFAATVAERVGAGDYFAVLFAAGAQGRDLAPRVAAKLDVPLAADATGLAVEDGELVVTRPVYAGRAFAKVTLDAQPRLVSVRPNTFRPEESEGAGTVENVSVSTAPSRVKVRETKAAEGAKMDVADAPIVVSGGRGLKGPEHWTLLEQLRDALGSTAALGASRAVVDAGWRPHAEQVGQTGKTVSPQLYFAVGISGAMQHLAGMRSARTIVAINKDPDAPIFKVADYGIVGDAHEVVPALAEEIRKGR
ncbi:MAG TPA: electron transfer flavoprotein subunit alpha/FixB family protein [Longimicrobiales bacterium]|nr:electron transfer flavoprotein subunit alpha/FixB family protein [Longimicrobiales bacterium]